MEQYLRLEKGLAREGVIIPVFGQHVVGAELTRMGQEFQKRLESGGVYPDVHAWPEQTIGEVQELNPGLISIDGMFAHRPSVNVFRRVDEVFWFSFPGNPFTLRREDQDTFVVDGDYGAEELYEEPNSPLDLMTLVAQQYSKPGSAGENQSSQLATSLTSRRAFLQEAFSRTKKELPLIGRESVDLDEFALIENMFRHQAQREQGLSIIVGVLGALRALATNPNIDLSRRQFNRVLGALFGGLSVANFTRVSPNYNDPPWRRPIGSNDPLDFWNDPDAREAAVAIKLREAHSRIPPAERPNGPLVAVFGTAHKYGRENTFNQSSIQQQILRDVCLKILRSFKEGLKGKEGIDVNAIMEAKIQEMTQLLGGVAVWRVKSPPTTLTPEAVKKQIELEATFVSPTIKKIITGAAQEVGLL